AVRRVGLVVEVLLGALAKGLLVPEQPDLDQLGRPRLEVLGLEELDRPLEDAARVVLDRRRRLVADHHERGLHDDGEALAEPGLERGAALAELLGRGLGRGAGGEREMTGETRN